MADEYADLTFVAMEFVGPDKIKCAAMADYWKGYIGMEVGRKLIEDRHQWVRPMAPVKSTAKVLRVTWKVTDEPYWPARTGPLMIGDEWHSSFDVEQAKGKVK